MAEPKVTLEQRNAAQAEITRDNELRRLLGDSTSLSITGSNRGDGKWHADLPAEDYTAVKDFLEKRISARMKQNAKIIGE